jgi:hypothetical protein
MSIAIGRLAAALVTIMKGTADNRDPGSTEEISNGYTVNLSLSGAAVYAALPPGGVWKPTLVYRRGVEPGSAAERRSVTRSRSRVIGMIIWPWIEDHVDANL